MHLLKNKVPVHIPLVPVGGLKAERRVYLYSQINVSELKSATCKNVKFKRRITHSRNYQCNIYIFNNSKSYVTLKLFLSNSYYPVIKRLSCALTCG